MWVILRPQALGIMMEEWYLARRVEVNTWAVTGVSRLGSRDLRCCDRKHEPLGLPVPEASSIGERHVGLRRAVRHVAVSEDETIGREHEP